MGTKEDCNTAEVDISADTETTIATITIPSKMGGRIKKVWICGGPVATTVASCTGYMEADLSIHPGPHKIPVGAGNEDGDLGISPQFHQEFDVDWEVDANEVVTIKATMNGAIAGMHAGILWVVSGS